MLDVRVLVKITRNKGRQKGGPQGYSRKVTWPTRKKSKDCGKGGLMRVFITNKGNGTTEAVGRAAINHTGIYQEEVQGGINI